MRKAIIIMLAAAILIGGVSVTAQQVEEREITIQQRPIELLELDNNAEIRPDAVPDVRPLTDDVPVRPMNDVRTTNDEETPAPIVRIRPESVQDARELRFQETVERSAEVRNSVAQLRERQTEELRERREAFQVTVQEIADQARRERVERLADNINRVNENLSSRYNGFLSALELVLDKIEIRVGLVDDTTGADLSTVYSMIDDGREAIADTREAILGQRAKVYLVDIESIETMQDDFRVTMQEMRDDHAALRAESIDPLRTLVRDIVTALREETARSAEENNND